MQKIGTARIFFILMLFGTAAGASLFMVFEAAAFYARFYPGENGYKFGLAAAVLNELFLVIMAAIWLPAVNFGGFKFWHPGNLFIKSLMLVLFFNTVGGATFNVVESKLKELETQKNRIAILKVREKQLIDAQKKLDAFIQQNQPINTAIAARELANVQSEMVRLREDSQSTTTLWIDIVMLTFLRFSIQLSNITSVWIGSWLYRQPQASSVNILHGLQGDFKNLGAELKAGDKKTIANSNPPKISQQTVAEPPAKTVAEPPAQTVAKPPAQTAAEPPAQTLAEPPAQPLPLKPRATPPAKTVLKQSLKPEAKISQSSISNASSEVNDALDKRPPPEAKIPNENQQLLDEEATETKDQILEFLAELSYHESEKSLCQKLKLNYTEFKRLLEKSESWSAAEIKNLVLIKEKIERKFKSERNA